MGPILGDTNFITVRHITYGQKERYLYNECRILRAPHRRLAPLRVRQRLVKGLEVTPATSRWH